MEEMNHCQALINQGPRKGQLCNKLTTEKYCIKHIRHNIIDKSKLENIKYCDISRGCFVVLEENQAKCSNCLHKARIRDRKREDKKRQDPNLCLDCGILMNDENRAVGKHDKKLRRCIKCYEILQKSEIKRFREERNYKSEAFKNKYVAWNHYIKGSKKRNIDFKISNKLFNSLIIKPCFYCNYYKENEIIGIDRIDNNKGYVEENVVSCCEICNSLKGSQHPQEFIDKIKSIYNYTILSYPITEDIITKWNSTYLSKYEPKFKNYSKSANGRNLEFTISETDFNSIISKRCYLCGIKSSEINTNGIDRFNNNLGYILENCRPCCGHCNIMKKDISYDKLLKISEKITNNYDKLTEYFKSFQITHRNSKIESRIKLENPDIQEPVQREYKSLNEIFNPKLEIPLEINKIITKKDDDETPSLKQWKAKQIYEAISTNKENEYKNYCEKNNDISLIKTWNEDWITFINYIKDKSFEESQQKIKEFVENLRRIRHNKLCYDKNSKIIDRENRQKWQNTSIVRAFIEGKIHLFKEYMEEHCDENPENKKWLKKWNSFVEILEKNKNDIEAMKNESSKFMNSQRIKKYRKNKNESVSNEPNNT
jgi:hypothetical protein